MATTTLMSFGEFERLDFGADKVELLNGELIRMPPAKVGHNQIAQKLFLSLHGAIESLRQSSPDFHLGSANHEMGYCLSREPGKWLQPDVSITHAGQAADEDYYLGSPLIAFEVISEGESADALDDKVAAYLAHGAAEVWLIYPKQRHAWVYPAIGGVARLETKSVQSEALPGIRIPLDEIL